MALWGQKNLCLPKRPKQNAEAGSQWRFRIRKIFLIVMVWQGSVSGEGIWNVLPTHRWLCSDCVVYDLS